MGGEKRSGVARNKRPDFRASAKKRRREQQAATDAKEAVTYKKRKEERDAAGGPRERVGPGPGQELRETAAQKAAKKVKALEKRLRHIAELEARAEGGGGLDEQQQAKLDAKAELEAELLLFQSGRMG